MNRRALFNIARLLISAGLLAWVVTHSGLSVLWELARRADPALLAGAYALALAGMFLRSARWGILLRAVGARVSFRRALYLYFAGGFFNVFLPTGFGGDVLRVLEIGPGASREQAAGTVLVDRLSGFVALFLLALAALPFSADLLPRQTALLIGLLAGGVCVGSALLFEGRLLKRWLDGRPRTEDGPRSPVSGLRSSLDWLSRTFAVIAACGGRAVASAIGVSLLYNASAIWACALIGRALGLQIPLLYYALFLPLVVASLLVPISISGLGVREGLMIVLFAQAGLGAAQAAALSLGFYSLDVFTGLLGGGVYVLAGVMGLRSRPVVPPPDASPD